MSDWVTEMFPSDALLKDGIAAAGSGEEGDFRAYNIQNPRRNTLHRGIISLDGDDKARRPLIVDRESLASVASPSQGDIDFPSQLAAHELGVFAAKASQKTPDVYEVQCPTGWTEVDPFSQAGEINSSSLAQSGSFAYDFLSQLSTPLVQQEDGGNSRPSEDTIAWSEVDAAFDFWRDPPRFGSHNDAIAPQHMLLLNQFKDNSRYGKSTEASSCNSSSGKMPLRFPKGQASKGLSNRYINKRDRRLGRTLAANSDDVDSFSSPFQRSDLEMTNLSQNEANGRAFMGKRKRADGGSQAVLEGIFIVTRRPNNGEICRIADHIGWEFQDVNMWFERRARWEASHTSSTGSQNSNVPSASSTINILPQDMDDSGFFELPDKPTGARRPKKRLKCHTTSVRKKLENGNDQENKVDAKIYPCIHETCCHSFTKFGEWKRHMASVHYPDRWACLLKEESQSLPIDGKCPSCETSFHSMRDLKEHIHLSTGCQDAEFVWVFDRKDKVGAHWKRCHEFDSGSNRLGDEHLCEREIRDFDQNCGFCNMSFTNWDNKIDHVGSHFKDEGRKMSTWRYPHCDERRSSLERLLRDGQALLPEDLIADSDNENIDSDDSDDSDDDDMGDRPKMSTNNRRNDRDPDIDGNSASRNNFPPPPDDSHFGGGESSSQNSKDNSTYGGSCNMQNYSLSAWGNDVHAGDKILTAATSKLHLGPLFSSETVPTYENIGSLGRGGFGSVDKIRIEGTNQVVAKKRIRLFSDQSRHIELEMIQKLRNLDHPHIIRFLGSYVTDSHVDILMSPVADYDLNEFMHQQYLPMPMAVKTQIASFYGCLVSALKYIHERDIRHRDIKPKNILVANGNVLIADFGSATDIYHEARNKSIGITPKYTAPEVFSSGYHRCASDIWSLGCVFTELATIIHDKSLFELEIFLSSNAKSKKTQSFHKSARKLHEWLNVLSGIRTIPPLTWQGVSYLDTISKMLQDDEIERPSATQLLLRFPPSQCCSMTTDGAISSVPPIPSGFMDIGCDECTSLAVSESLEEKLYGMEVAGTISFSQSLINCLILTRVISSEVTKNLSTERSGYRNIINETKKNIMSQSKSGLPDIYSREISYSTNIKLKGLRVPSQVASPEWFTDKFRRYMLQTLVEGGGFESSFRVPRPHLTGKEHGSINRRGFVQLNHDTYQDPQVKQSKWGVTSALRNVVTGSERRMSDYDGSGLLLDPESRWIRVFDLEPMLSGDPDEPIRGQLRLVSLNDKPLYTALSYAWDNLSPSRQIACRTACSTATTNLCVTASCYNALHQMRHRFQTRTLWIDSICIDQGSQKEKLHQISLIRDIYGQAESVYLWLSRDHLQLDDEMDWRRDTFLDFLPKEGVFDRRYYTEDENTILQYNPFYGQIAFLGRIKHYWKRLWVIQEIGLSETFQQIQYRIQREVHNLMGYHLNVQLENILWYIAERRVFERCKTLNIKLDFRVEKVIQMLESISEDDWKFLHAAGTGTFLPLRGSGTLSIPMQERIKDKIEELMSSMDIIRKFNGIRKNCKQKDEDTYNFGTFFKAKCYFLAFVGSSRQYIHNIDLRQIGHVNFWDKKTLSPGERNAFQLFLDWRCAIRYGNSFNVYEMKPHTNFGVGDTHMSGNRYEMSKTGSCCGLLEDNLHCNHFICRDSLSFNSCNILDIFVDLGFVVVELTHVSLIVLFDKC